MKWIKITNDVHQGGIFSPKLFCKYTDELSRGFFYKENFIKKSAKLHIQKKNIHTYIHRRKQNNI